MESIMNEVQQFTIVKFDHDYDKFKMIEANRNVTHADAIAHSITIKNLSRFMPILVNEKYEIIDGQNRFLACKKLKLPIYYIVGKGLGHEEMIILNTNQKNWTPKDYLKYWVIMQNSNYINMKNVHEKTGFPLAIIYKLGVAPKAPVGVDDPKIRRGYAQNAVAFKKGRTIFNMNHVQLAYKVYDLYELIKNSVDVSVEMRVLIPVLVSIVKSIDIDTERLKYKIRKHSYMFSKQGDRKQYIQLFEDIYNRNSRNKVPFNFKYKK